MRDYAATALAEVESFTRLETPEKALLCKILECALNELSCKEPYTPPKRRSGQLSFIFVTLPPGKQETLRWFLSNKFHCEPAQGISFMFIAQALNLSSSAIAALRKEARERALI